MGLALDRPREPAAYREVLERVGRESTRLRRIVEDLLWLATGGQPDRRAPTRPTSPTWPRSPRAALERFGALAATHGVALSVQRVGRDPSRCRRSRT